ncbi:MAG: alpha/beta hydrolase [Myxococcales bacterium]|nr:alpha/beta hydrolase [Myxococcales bacterium]
MREAVPALGCGDRSSGSGTTGQGIADRMVDDVLANGRLAVVAQAGHSVMTDNPSGFNDAVLSFVLEG